jgi:hypothetical protein
MFGRLASLRKLEPAEVPIRDEGRCVHEEHPRNDRRSFAVGGRTRDCRDEHELAETGKSRDLDQTCDAREVFDGRQNREAFAQGER